MRIVLFEKIRARVALLRDQRVMLSGDLAELYGVEHRALLQAVKRNRGSFPRDFMFRLNPGEVQSLRSQIVISNAGRGGARYAPCAFTEQGVAMLSSVLKSRRARQVNIGIMRVFVKMRQFVIDNEELARQVAELKRETDGRFKLVFDALAEIAVPPRTPPRRPIGF